MAMILWLRLSPRIASISSRWVPKSASHSPATERGHIKQPLDLDEDWTVLWGPRLVQLPPPLVARFGFFVLFAGGAWLIWRVNAKWFKAMSTAKPEKAKALRVERIVAQALCVGMALIGLILLVG